ncbi:family 10 glycosylhydrolase [Bacteroides faecis]|nr:family 10 glycosylhydrolase [Bacteroides faecis]MCS3327215.1 family 10 glycosylhydrolase [Bacteroides faecis]
MISIRNGRPSIYVPRKGLLPVTEIEGKPTMFLNPALKEVQKYEIDIIKEVVRNYAFDGIMLDRARYDCIDSDFSPQSRKMFEKFYRKEDRQISGGYT